MPANMQKLNNITEDIKRAKELFDSKNYVDAKEIFERLLTENPDDEEIQNYLGMIFFKLGLHKEATELYKKLIDRSPDVPSLHLNLGIIYYKEGLLELAFEEFLNTLEFAPKNKRAQNYIGLIHMEKGNFDEALATFMLTGSKKMINEAKEKIREAKRAAIIASKSKVSGFSDQAIDDGEAGSAEILKGKGKLNFSDIKKSLAETRPTKVSSVKKTAEYMMRNVFKGKVSSGFVDIYHNLLKLNVKEKIYTKLSILESFSGDLNFEGAYKKVDDKVSDEMVGHDDDFIFKVFGKGSLILSLGSKSVTMFTLDNEEFYVKERYLLAFDNGVKYQTLSDRSLDNLNIIKLSGKGTVILMTDNDPITQVIDLENPLTIKLEYIIGWCGNLKSRIVKGSESLFKRREDAKWLTFKGSGHVFCIVK